MTEISERYLTKAQRVILYLRDNPRSSKDEISAALDVPRTTLWRHVNYLLQSGIVACEKNGKQKLYSLADISAVDELANSVEAYLRCVVAAHKRIRDNDVKRLEQELEFFED